MTDHSHPAQLPTIARLLDAAFNIELAWIEPRAKTGETPDVFGVLERGGEWADGVPFYSGQTVVCEYKSSVADLRADAGKDWRKPDAWALGDWRLYWLREDGDVRPEHVDDSGWGVVMYDDHGARIARPPQLFRRVNAPAQTELIVRLSRKDSAVSLSSKIQAANRLALLDAVKEELGYGPASTAHLRKMIGYKGSCGKLFKELIGYDELTPPALAGGSWELAKENA